VKFVKGSSVWMGTSYRGSRNFCVTTCTISGNCVTLAGLVCDLLIIGFSIPLAAQVSVTWLSGRSVINDNDNLFNIHNCYTGTIGQSVKQPKTTCQHLFKNVQNTIQGYVQYNPFLINIALL
jgi:hypothetical protein